MQEDDPAWVGYVYAFLIFVGVVCIITILFHLHFPKLSTIGLFSHCSYFLLKPQTIGVLCQSQYFQHVGRAAFRLRSTMVKFL